MSEAMTDKPILYTSRWCGHSLMVEKFLDRKGVDVRKIVIDGDKEARDRLIEINDGFASVPTLLFPDGSKLTEPSLGELRRKLSLKSGSGFGDRLRRLLSGNRVE